MQATKFLTLLLVASVSTAVNGQLDWASVTTPDSQSGQGTFYGLGQDSQGTCSFSANFANTNDLAWSTGTALTVALNDAQFADSAACGMCIMLKGTGAGLGTTPIPSTWTKALVNNRCPECAPGDVDLAAAGDGRWNIEWYAVPCEVGSSPLQYSIVVSSYYWFSMVVSNTRIPITGVSVKIGGSWLTLKRSNNNQWAYYNTNGPWQSSFPMGVRVTSISGQTIEDTITSPSGNAGTVQFSADGSGSTAASGGTGATSTASTSSTAVTPVAASPPPAATPPAVTPATPPAVPQSPPPLATPTPAPPTPSAPLTDGGFYIENYQQCGGSGGACNTKPYTAAPCSDAAWPVATCRSPSFACVRASAELYTCVPATSATTPSADTSRVTPAAATPPAQALTPPTPATATPTATPATPPTPVTSVTPAATTATPPTVDTSSATATSTATSQATTAATPPTTTSQDYGINKVADYSSYTPPTTSTPTQTASPTPASTPSTTPSTSTASTSRAAIAISAGGQCGGTSSCDPVGVPTDKVTCNNGPWSGAYCPNGYECKAAPGPLVWSCMASSTQTAGRRLLSSR